MNVKIKKFLNFKFLLFILFFLFLSIFKFDFNYEKITIIAEDKDKKYRNYNFYLENTNVKKNRERSNSNNKNKNQLKKILFLLLFILSFLVIAFFILESINFSLKASETLKKFRKIRKNNKNNLKIINDKNSEENKEVISFLNFFNAKKEWDEKKISSEDFFSKSRKNELKKNNCCRNYRSLFKNINKRKIHYKDFEATYKNIDMCELDDSIRFLNNNGNNLKNNKEIVLFTFGFDKEEDLLKLIKFLDKDKVNFYQEPISLENFLENFFYEHGKFKLDKINKKTFYNCLCEVFKSFLTFKSIAFCFKSKINEKIYFPLNVDSSKTKKNKKRRKLLEIGSFNFNLISFYKRLLKSIPEKDKNDCNNIVSIYNFEEEENKNEWTEKKKMSKIFFSLEKEKQKKKVFF